MREVDFLGLLGEDLDLAARVVVALLEGGESLGGAAFEAELGAQVRPVDLEGGGALQGGVSMLGLRRFGGAVAGTCPVALQRRLLV